MKFAAKLVPVAAFLAVAAAGTANASEPTLYSPDHLSGSVSPKSGAPALAFDMSLGTDGRFEKIAVTFEGRSFDLLNLRGAEKLKELKNVNLFAVSFAFEFPYDLDGMRENVPWVVFDYRPDSAQPELCDHGEKLLLTVGVRQGVIKYPATVHCGLR